MKIYLNIILVALLLCISSCNCNEKSTSNSQNQEAKNTTSLSTATIQKAVEEFNQLMIDPNAKAFDAFCSDELTYGHSSGLVQNKTEFIDDVVNGPYDFTSVSSPELSISISNNIGVARFIFLAKAVKDGEQIDIRIGCVQFFQLDQSDNLKLLARQAFKLPNPTN